LTFNAIIDQATNIPIEEILYVRLLQVVLSLD